MRKLLTLSPPTLSWAWPSADCFQRPSISYAPPTSQKLSTPLVVQLIFNHAAVSANPNWLIVYTYKKWHPDTQVFSLCLCSVPYKHWSKNVWGNKNNYIQIWPQTTQLHWVLACKYHILCLHTGGYDRQILNKDFSAPCKEKYRNCSLSTPG